MRIFALLAMVLPAATGFEFRSPIPLEMPVSYQNHLDRAHAQWDSQMSSRSRTGMKRGGGTIVDGEAVAETGLEDVYLEAQDTVSRLRTSDSTKQRRSTTHSMHMAPRREQPKIPEASCKVEEKPSTFFSPMRKTAKLKMKQAPCAVRGGH